MKRPVKTKTMGFVCYPDSAHYFVLQVNPGVNVCLWEKHNDSRGTETRHAVVHQGWWMRVKSTVRAHYNERLKAANCTQGKWKEYTNLDRFLGRELAVLMWGLEGCQDKADVEKVLGRWMGLQNTERWWLY